MNEVIHLRQVIQVKKQRANSYVTVDLVNTDGSLKKRDRTTTARFPEYAKDIATAGSLWEVSGQEQLNQFTINDFIITEYIIDVEKVKFLRPSSRSLSRWVSNNIEGIGSVIANRLLRVKNINLLIEQKDTTALSNISGMSKERVKNLIECWPHENLYSTIEWLEELRLPLKLGEKLVAIFGNEAIAQVESHPFLLMAMGTSFEKTLEVAISLGFSLSDPKIIAGIAQHIAIQYSAKSGSTVIPKQLLESHCLRIIKHIPSVDLGDTACEHGLLVKTGEGYQVFGAALMESAVAQFLVDIANRPSGTMSNEAGWEKVLTKSSIASALEAYEDELEYVLTADQRTAIVGSVFNPVACISGGAGTGKTTILKAIVEIYSILAEHLACYQVALSGRAAQHMTESTSRPAATIAKFTGEYLTKKKSNLPDHLLLIIDEASMVDLLSMYRLVGILPIATRLIFVGDTAQLPPIGSGLVFHSLKDTGIPFFNLSQVKRQHSQSPVLRFALSLRNSILESPPQSARTLALSEDCSIEQSLSVDRLKVLWKQAGSIENKIVLSPIKKGEFGVDNLNSELQSCTGQDRERVHYNNPSKGWIPWVTSCGTNLLRGDPILVVANNYDEQADLRNGDLGVVTDVFDQPDNNGTFGIMTVNGKSIHLTYQVLKKLNLGYAITIHKAQGSQWDTCFVILPDDGIGMIEQSLLYTASTRASKKLVLMGNLNIIKNALDRGSLASNRKVFLKERIETAKQMYSLN